MKIKTKGYYRTERIYWTDIIMGQKESGWARNFIYFNDSGEVFITLKQKSDIFSISELSEPFRFSIAKYKYKNENIIEYIIGEGESDLSIDRIEIVNEDTIIHWERVFTFCNFGENAVNVEEKNEVKGDTVQENEDKNKVLGHQTKKKNWWEFWK